MPLTVTIIFEGDPNVGQKDEVYTMELPYDEKHWSRHDEREKEWVRNKIWDVYNWLHQEQTCRVLLPGEKY